MLGEPLSNDVDVVAGAFAQRTCRLRVTRLLAISRKMGILHDYLAEAEPGSQKARALEQQLRRRQAHLDTQFDRWWRRAEPRIQASPFHTDGDEQLALNA